MIWTLLGLLVAGTLVGDLFFKNCGCAGDPPDEDPSPVGPSPSSHPVLAAAQELRAEAENVDA